MPLETLLPAGWPRPRGYANGMSGTGRVITVGGQIGWDTEGRFASGFVPQVAQALDNVLAVLAAGGAGPGDVASMTWYVVDMPAYRAAAKELGPTWRDRFGRHYPAMAVVGVPCLVETEALVEIEALAIVQVEGQPAFQAEHG